MVSVDPQQPMDDYAGEIESELSDLESELQSRTVLVRDTGSHGEGTAHPGSDLDLFVVMVQRPDLLYNTERQLDVDVRTIESIGNGVDLSIWSLATLVGVFGNERKTVYDNDPNIIEAFLSDVDVWWGETPSAFGELEAHILESLNRYSLFHHYRSKALSNFERYCVDDHIPDIKSYFTVVDSLLRARYIEDTGTVPSLDADFRAETYDDSAVRTLRDQLEYGAIRDAKARGERGDVHTVLDEWTVEYAVLESELTHEPRPYDSDVFGTGPDSEVVGELAEATARAMWPEHFGNIPS